MGLHDPRVKRRPSTIGVGAQAKAKGYGFQAEAAAYAGYRLSSIYDAWAESLFG